MFQFNIKEKSRYIDFKFACLIYNNFLLKNNTNEDLQSKYYHKGECNTISMRSFLINNSTYWMIYVLYLDSLTLYHYYTGVYYQQTFWAEDALPQALIHN
jgi:hypothetical protein